MRNLHHARGNAGVDRPDQDIDLVAVDQLAGALGALGRVGFVVERNVVDVASAELAALLRDGETQRLVDVAAERGVGAAIG